MTRQFTKCIAQLSAALVIATAGVAPAYAGLGDCGQPQSEGDTPTASDALLTLRCAVGLNACDLEVCDVDGNCSVSAGDALRILRVAVGQAVELLCTDACGTTTSTLPPSTSTTSTTSTSVTTTTLPAATWSDVFAILLPRGCGAAGCHGSIIPQAELSGLDNIDTAYDALVGVASSQLPSMKRVEPFDVDRSYLLHKLSGTQLDVGGEGAQMPVSGLPLDDAQLAKIRSWITAGALR